MAMNSGRTGTEQPITAETLREMPLPHPGEHGDKERRGRVLVVGGSLEVPGAALLAGIGALRAGAGKLQIATCRSIAPHIGLAVPECLALGLAETEEGGIAPEAAATLIRHAARCSALLIGPGMMAGPAVEALTAALLDGLEGPSILLDAEALIGLADQAPLVRRHGGRMVITPHAGEMAGLLGIPREAVEADPLDAARLAASHLQAVVVLKGSRTRIVTPQGKAWSYSEGCVGLATSGSGDALAGILAGLLARGATPVQAAVWAVHLHGEAGNRLSRTLGPLGFLARELLAEVPRILGNATG